MSKYFLNAVQGLSLRLRRWRCGGHAWFGLAGCPGRVFASQGAGEVEELAVRGGRWPVAEWGKGGGGAGEGWREG